MPRLHNVPVAGMDAHRFASVISREEYSALLGLIDDSARSLRGRVVWNVSSTATGDRTTPGSIADVRSSPAPYCQMQIGRRPTTDRRTP